MGRKTFFDIVKEEGFDARAELENLLSLLSEGHYVQFFGNYSLLSFIDRQAFRKAPIHDTFLHFEDQIKYVMNKTSSMSSLNAFLIFCEYVNTLFKEVEKKIVTVPEMWEQMRTIRNNITVSLKKINCVFSKDAAGNEIIVEEDHALTDAVDLVGNKPIAFQLVNYKHFSNKGNITEKRKILMSIAAYLEPQLKEHVLKNHKYEVLETNLGFLFNNLNIRHDNTCGKSHQEFTASLDNKGLEQWYDKTYQTSLMAIIALESQIGIDDNIEEIKANYVWK